MKQPLAGASRWIPTAGAVAAAAALLAACASQTRYQLLTTFVDGVPPYEEWLHPETAKKPGQGTEALAAKPPASGPTLREFSEEGRPAIEELSNWDEALAELPKMKVPKAPKNAVDWMAALDEKLISPLRSLDKDAPPPETRDTEVPLKGKEGVIFHHATHTRWLACDNCHDAIFPKASGETKMANTAALATARERSRST
jgi:hypothetical protein